MVRKSLFLGISAAALAAGMASAQTTDTTDANGNRRIIDCSPGNTCAVDNQVSGNDRNFGSVSARNGTGNNLAITQRGNDNSSTIRANGNSNTGHTRQTGDDHRASTDQTGNFHTSSIDQGDEDNSATVIQVGAVSATSASANSSTVWQGTDSSGGSAPSSDRGENNVASVSQNGSNLGSVVIQSRLSYFEELGFGGFRAPADDNSATVVQTGAGSQSNLYQFSRGNIARVNMSDGGVDNSSGTRRNSATIVQYNEFYTLDSNGQLVAPSRAAGDPQTGPAPTHNPLSQNTADIAIIGIQNSAYAEQDGVLNTAIVSMLGGGSGNTGSTSDLSQPGNVGPSGRQLPENRKEGNDSIMYQYGRGNFARLSSGGLGGRGNKSRIDQGVYTNFKVYTEGDLGRDHRALVWQRGVLDSSWIIQENNRRGPGGAAQFGSFADVAQLSFNSSVYLEQRGTNTGRVSQALNADGTGGDNTILIRQNDAGDLTSSGTPGDIFGTGGSSGSTTQLRNNVSVSQAGIANGITIDQNARNANAVVWQQRNSRDNSAEIEQGTGGQATAGENNVAQSNHHIGPSSGGGFLAGPDQVPAESADTGAGAINLAADITHIGRGSTARIRQDGQDLSALVSQAGTRTSSGVAVDSTNFAGVSQINAWNSATVTQNGFLHSATVDQRGTGEAGLRNLVTIQQSGNSHTALARQHATVNPTPASCGTNNVNCPQAGDPSNPTTFPNSRAAGTRYSAEIRIIQTGSTSGTTSPGNTGNNATVDQHGDGQYAEINQNGRGNTAGILQGASATNAVAIIRQNGDGNTFFITQNTAGQYLFVQQNGNNNTNETRISAGPSGGGATATGTGATQPGL